jgi:hypothetical protein
MSSLADGARFLRAGQAPDGMWRDYALEPGAAETWTTCAAALALAAVEPSAAHAGPVGRARAAVHARARCDGWAYNAHTACDADSTAWAVRLLGTGAAALGPYLDPAGHAHTFADPALFGTWAGRHADVTALAGLALVAAGAPGDAIATVRAAVLAARTPGGGWCAFWWTTDLYASARALELLAASGGIPPEAATGARAQLAGARARAAESALDAAQRLHVAMLAGADARPHRADLLRRQDPDGGWPPSPALLVPDQRTGAPGPPHADPGRVMTTALALLALAATA